MLLLINIPVAMNNVFLSYFSVALFIAKHKLINRFSKGIWKQMTVDLSMQIQVGSICIDNQ